MRGQVSFEALFLMLLILTSSIYISGLYFSTSNETMAISIARPDLLNQINSLDKKVMLEEVYVKSSENGDGLKGTIRVTTTPPLLKEEDLDGQLLNDTKAKILDTTSFDSIEFEIN